MILVRLQVDPSFVGYSAAGLSTILKGKIEFAIPIPIAITISVTIAVTTIAIAIAIAIAVSISITISSGSPHGFLDLIISYLRQGYDIIAYTK